MKLRAQLGGYVPPVRVLTPSLTLCSTSIYFSFTYICLHTHVLQRNILVLFLIYFFSKYYINVSMVLWSKLPIGSVNYTPISYFHPTDYRNSLIIHTKKTHIFIY